MVLNGHWMLLYGINFTRGHYKNTCGGNENSNIKTQTHFFNPFSDVTMIRRPPIPTCALIISIWLQIEVKPKSWSPASTDRYHTPINSAHLAASASYLFNVSSSHPLMVWACLNWNLFSTRSRSWIWPVIEKPTKNMFTKADVLGTLD